MTLPDERSPRLSVRAFRLPVAAALEQEPLTPAFYP
jgi:hypothetical protein